MQSEKNPRVRGLIHTTSQKNIDSILSALNVDEIEALRQSTFGKLIVKSEKPSFSGSFGQYMITRMLKVSKKHEIWFLFAGKPIKVSLREFAIVTGLPFYAPDGHTRSSGQVYCIICLGIANLT